MIATRPPTGPSSWERVLTGMGPRVGGGVGPARDRWRAGRREEVTARDVWCHCGAVSATEQAPAQPRAVVAPRLRSLDVVRGLMLVVSVAVNSLVVLLLSACLAVAFLGRVLLDLSPLEALDVLLHVFPHRGVQL